MVFLNEQLRAIYEIYYKEFIHNVKDMGSYVVQPTNPLLICIDNEDKYQASDIKILFFGQETNDWEGPCGKDINHLTSIYKKFFGEVKEGRHGGPFWNVVRDFIKSVKQNNPDQKIDYVWNNILKIGRADTKGTPTPEIIELQHEYFPAIRAEMEILRPDVVVFFTGPYYDQYIKHEFPDAEFINIQDMKEYEICKIYSNKLPARTFRTYHPQYLVLRMKEILKVLKEQLG